MRQQPAHILLIVAFLFCMLASCRQEVVNPDSSLRLTLSTDSLAFDTVFTVAGSSTRRVTLYNRNPNAVVISSAQLEVGDYFLVNIDGEQDRTRWQDITIRGGDSAFIFIRASIDPQNQNNPVIVHDRLLLHYNGNTLALHLSAIAQDVTVLPQKRYQMPCHFTATKPYLVMDTLIFEQSVNIDAGATFYMHKNAAFFALNDFSASGSINQPILFRGDRMDQLFDSVPYAYASGQWSGIYLLADGKQTYTFRYVDILSGNIGLYCQNSSLTALPELTIDGCRIHNMAVYGLICLNQNATITNTEISNCAAYCIYLHGGNYHLIHSTIAAYFGYPYTTINIHSTHREDVAAVCVVNAPSDTTIATSAYIYNNIITGARADNLLLLTNDTTAFPGAVCGNYLKADSFLLPEVTDNVYASDTDIVFVNNHYLYKEYRYFDFRLDSLSPAIGVGIPAFSEPYPTDRQGLLRLPVPDAGCYQYTN